MQLYERLHLIWIESLFRGGRRRSTQQALGADVLVDVWPMDAVSAAGNFPIAALLGSALEQPWIPCQRDRDRAAILQADAQRAFVETDVGHSLICRYCQNTHSRPPRAVADLPEIGRTS